MSEYLWVEKYRPKKISECILSEDIKKTFSEFLRIFLRKALPKKPVPPKIIIFLTIQSIYLF